VAIADFFVEVAELIVRDGLIESLKWLFTPRKQKALDKERMKILAKRRLDRCNRRARRRE
jgi:hypothetical protein